jgi:uncharacterized membrane protein (UPF0127 family)
LRRASGAQSEDRADGGDRRVSRAPELDRVTIRLSTGEELECRVARNFIGRLVGLLGTDARLVAGESVAFPRCRSVHTFGMSYPIDVAFLDGSGRVLLSRRHMPPMSVAGCPGAAMAIERPSSGAAWPVCGETLDVSATVSPVV